ncbi:MAG: hypothetical protein M3178_01115 [Pseudomonadota bacterium]|nr:hypothetical protein [Pseudomonadota bacterium]
MPETPDGLDQRGVIGGAGAVVPDAVWRQAQDRALAALEMPGIVVVLGPAGVSGTFLQELMAGLGNLGRDVTFLPRAVTLPRVGPPRWWPPGSALIIEDVAGMDVAMLEEICRPPGRRIVLAGLPASALAGLPAPLTPAPLTVVTLEPLSHGTAAALRFSGSKARVAIESGVLASALAKLPAPLTGVPRELMSLRAAAAPRSSSRSNAQVAIASGVLAVTGVFGARMAIASGVLAATSVAGALLWTRVPSAPPAPAPSRVAVLQPEVELPPAPGFPPAPAEPAPSASEQPGDTTSAAAPAPRPVGDEDRPGIGTSLELPAVPLVTQTESRSGSEPAPPQLQAGPSPVPDSREALNLPPAAAIAAPPLAEAPRATPSEPAAPSGNAPQLLPDNAPIRVMVSYASRSAAARQEAAGVVLLLRGGGLAASDPAPSTRVAGKAGITYFFAEDRDGARRVEHDLGEGFGPSRLSPAARGAPLPRPGTIEVLVPER